MLHNNKFMLFFANGNLLQLLLQGGKLIQQHLKQNAYRNTLTQKKQTKVSSNGKLESAH